MGLEISLHRTRRKTEPLSVSNRNRKKTLDDRERTFDDINLQESNPFLSTPNRNTVVPQSLKQFMEVQENFRGHLNFYADAVSCVTVSYQVVINTIISSFTFTCLQIRCLSLYQQADCLYHYGTHIELCFPLYRNKIIGYAVDCLRHKFFIPVVRAYSLIFHFSI